MTDANSSIEWTESTWSPVTGCTKVSPGCDHCYAEGIASRFAGTKAFPNGFAVTLRPERLEQPLKWKRPRKIFVNSMSDLFHDEVPDEFIARVFGIMAAAPQHTFQLLTKRHARMRSLLNDPLFHEDVFLSNNLDQGDVLGDGWPLPNLHLGVSVENQQWADLRIPALLDTPAAVRWLSMEPLLGPVDLSRWMASVDFPECWDDHAPSAECARCIRPTWIVVGGESGHGARPMQQDWVRSLRDQCVSAGVSFFFKQWGEWVDSEQMPEATWSWLDSAINLGQEMHPEPHRVGKKRAGRLLDGRTWDEYPEPALAVTP